MNGKANQLQRVTSLQELADVAEALRERDIVLKKDGVTRRGPLIGIIVERPPILTLSVDWWAKRKPEGGWQQDAETPLRLTVPLNVGTVVQTLNRYTLTNPGSWEATILPPFDNLSFFDFDL